MKFILIVIGLVAAFLDESTASAGDEDPIYYECVRDCHHFNCTNVGHNYRNPSKLPILTRLLWTCSDECQYNCMWHQINFYSQPRYLPQIHQFHGKWPFIRFLWMQEPASVIFSFLNLLVNLSMFRQFLQRFDAQTPMYRIWSLYGFIVINTWVWSMIFHSRDLRFTELMDYLSATSSVYFFTYAIGLRFILGYINFFKLLFTTCWAYFYLGHISLLTVERFDYKYNMKSNIICGGVAIASSIIWSVVNYKRLPHTKYLLGFVLLTGVTAILEVMDFPPYLWTFDAHSLWHLATVPLPLLLWRFIIQDCKYLANNNVYQKSNKL